MICSNVSHGTASMPPLPQCCNSFMCRVGLPCSLKRHCEETAAGPRPLRQQSRHLICKHRVSAAQPMVETSPRFHHDTGEVWGPASCPLNGHIAFRVSMYEMATPSWCAWGRAERGESERELTLGFYSPAQLALGSMGLTEGLAPDLEAAVEKARPGQLQRAAFAAGDVCRPLAHIHNDVVDHTLCER